MRRLFVILIPLVFVFLWSTGFIAAKYALPYIEPFFLLLIRLVLTILAFCLLCLILRAERLTYVQAGHQIVAGLMIHGTYLGGVFAAIKWGMPAGIAAIASAILFVAAAFNGQIFVGGLAIVFVGTLLGFLLFNFPPASIFMGDAGSLVVGFFVALLTVRTTYYQQDQSGPWYPVLMPLVVTAVPLYDLTSVTLLRLRQGKSPFVGDTQHFSHRLRRGGLTDRQTVLMLYLATLCCGLGATFLYQVNLIGAVLIFLQTFLILAIIAIFESTVRHGTEID